MALRRVSSCPVMTMIGTEAKRSSRFSSRSRP
jgi:hypothetical protein